MLYEPSTLAVVIFCLFVGVTLGLSFWLGRKAKSAQSYFAAHGEIPWFVNGVAFAGDYLSAASFLGICGMIAFYGYDGFLYSIGYLAGWIVALFVIAEPMKRLGKFTFADALDAKFQSPGIKIAAGISTLVISLFYLIPQMVGAGALIRPLLGFDHATGVVLVGVVVMLIVVTAGMVSTTWVQFIKGTLLVVLCGLMVGMILQRGFHRNDSTSDYPDFWVESTRHGYDSTGFWKSPKHPRLFSTQHISEELDENLKHFGVTEYKVLRQEVKGRTVLTFVLIKDSHTNQQSIWSSREPVTYPEPDFLKSFYRGGGTFFECQYVWSRPGLPKLINGEEVVPGKKQPSLYPVSGIGSLGRWKKDVAPYNGGPLGPIAYLRVFSELSVNRWETTNIELGDGSKLSIYHYPGYGNFGRDLLVPGGSPTFAGIKSDKWIDKLDFISLMLALFCGTASLPHILIRYYTVKDQRAARLSTIVGIASIGVFYILTLYIGLAAMTSLVLDPSDSNMAAPLLARSFGEWMFAAVSAVAFTTVLGTVSGLILAASGAVAHDLMAHGFGVQLDDNGKVRVAKISAIVVGLIAIVLGIVFQGFNVTFLVGWAFNIAASANLPSLIMLLFWKKTTKQGIITAILVGLLSSLTWVLLSKDALTKLYGYSGDVIPLVPFSQPGIVTIPLGFLTLIAVSLLTQRPEQSKPA